MKHLNDNFDHEFWWLQLGLNPGRREKKICFQSSWLKKKLTQAAAKLFFLSRITISLFLKLALFICILHFLSCIDVLFYFTPYKFQCNSTDLHTLYHSQTHFEDLVLTEYRKYVFYEVEQANNFLSSLITNFRLLSSLSQ